MSTNTTIDELSNLKPVKAVKELDVDPITDETAGEQIVYQKESNYIFHQPEKQVSVFDVASYILTKTGIITTMKLHKLLYYCQAWSLVWDETPLFSEKIEAWANGPVIRSFFYYHRGHFQISSVPIGNADLLNKDQRETVDAVVTFYGNKSAQWLIDLTHNEGPWKIARTGLAPLERGENEITLDAMSEYYSSL